MSWLPPFIRKNPGLWRAVAWVLATFVAGFLISNFILMPLFVRHGAEVEVPDVKTMNISRATQLLAEKGLEISVVGWQYDQNLPDSSVISQEPEPRMMIKRGRKVKVVLSRGAEKIAVPYLTGLTTVRAMNLLDRTGFIVSGIDSLASDSIAFGCVVKSDPEPGTKLERGAGVKITVSRGPTEGKMLMPDLVGKKLAEYQGQLVAQGLVIGEIRYVPGQSLEPGTIVLQAPQPGFVVKRGDTVSFGVSAN
jgi:beta-lactam-binding protein with PASTA domain